MFGVCCMTHHKCVGALDPVAWNRKGLRHIGLRGLIWRFPFGEILNLSSVNQTYVRIITGSASWRRNSDRLLECYPRGPTWERLCSSLVTDTRQSFRRTMSELPSATAARIERPSDDQDKRRAMNVARSPKSVI